MLDPVSLALAAIVAGALASTLIAGGFLPSLAFTLTLVIVTVLAERRRRARG